MAKRETVKQEGARRTSGASPKKEQPTELDVKQAVAKATQFFRDLLPNAADLSLEEVERSGQYWHITLGYIESKLPDPLAALRGEGDRLYKTISIDADTGEAVSMKIRKP